MVLLALRLMTQMTIPDMGIITVEILVKSMLRLMELTDF